MTLLSVDLILGVCGLVVGAVALAIARDRTHPHRRGSAAFWGILAVVTGAGPWIPPAVVGYAVVVLAVLAAARAVEPPAFRGADPAELARRAAELGNRLLRPVLVVPAIAVAGGLILYRIRFGDLAVVTENQAAQVALGLGCLVGLGWALRTTRETPRTAVTEGGRLLQLIGWALVLPQALAALGGILGKAGVGEEIARLVAAALPVQDPFVAVLAYCAGMAVFTILFGNAFAAFPVMTLGIGLPFIVRAHGGDPAVMGALGMLSGYCGTLVTPMAANFNIVPVRLLELRGDFTVIRAQAPFAAAIWLFNVAVMYASVYAPGP
ncbi:MAG TPA: DUF979 family protein [Opitutaceae bacterium]|nr:DUF979 family protein [Opitutaceae bacterium]